MSLAKLFLSGLLVAGGLILGAFTLHGYLDPQWAQNQAQAAGTHEGSQAPKSVNVFHNRSRFVSRSETAATPRDRPPAATAAVITPAVAKSADVKPTTATKPAVKKKVAEKPKPQPQQVSIWPFNLFNSN